MTDVEIEKLAESIAKKLAGELYTLPDVFWDGLDENYPIYLTAPIPIPTANRHCPFMVQIQVDQTNRLLHFKFTDVNGAMIKEWTIG